MPLMFRPINNPRRISQDFLKKMTAEEVPGSWIAQPKYDGWRSQAYKADGKWTFYAKTGEPASKQPPDDLKAELAELFADQDGLALDMEWMGPRCAPELKNRYGPGYNGFRIFDLLYMNGLWLGNDPFSQRYANLKTVMELAKAKTEAPRILLTPAVDRDWDRMFEETKKDDLLEGVVLRRSKSKIILAEDNPQWYKAKYRNIHEKTLF